MRIIAIESSGRHGSLAALVAEGGRLALRTETKLRQSEGRTAQTMAPALKSLLDDLRWTPKSIDLVAVTVGPGSFTGLRIGVTTAKTLAYAVGAQLVGVNTLEVLAEQAPPACARLWTILDAQRQELFVARFDDAPSGQSAKPPATTTSILRKTEWLAMLRPGDRVTGPPLEKLAAELPDGVTATPHDSWLPMAGATGRVAFRAYQAGQRDDVWQLVPLYLRASAAEEKAIQSMA